MTTNRFLTVLNNARQLVTAISTSAGSGDANKIVATASNGRLDPSLMAGVPYLLYADIKSSGINGGDNAIGAWTTRTLNTEIIDTANLGIIASNQITLAAGTYRFLGKSCFYATDRTQIRLYNATDNAVITAQASLNTFAHFGGLVQAVAQCYGRFTISSSKAFRLEYCAETLATWGLGVPTAFGSECYSTVEFWREL